MTNPINTKSKSKKTRKHKRQQPQPQPQPHPKKQKGGVKYSAGGNKEQNQFLDFLFPKEEEKKKSTDIKFPYNASFNNGSLLGVDFRFYLPRAAKTESKYNYSIDDYMKIIRVAKDIPRDDPRYNQLRDYVKRIIEKDPKTHKISYFNAIDLILKGDPELGELKCETKKRDDKDYGEIKEGKELFTALNIDFFDFEREANVRYLNYVFSISDTASDTASDTSDPNSNFDSKIKYFIISSNTSDFFKAVYYTANLLPDTQSPQQNIGINLTGDEESCQYVKSCFLILLFCLLVDNLQKSTTLENEKVHIFNGITKQRNEFVEKIKTLLKDPNQDSNQDSNQDPTPEDLEAKKKKHREYFHDYIKNVDEIIKNFSPFRSDNAQVKFPEIAEKDLYYLLVTNDSYSNLNAIIAKYATPNFLQLIEKYDLPFELVMTQELMGKENIKTDKIEGEYEKQINELFNLKKESITDYIKNGVTTVVTMNENKEIIVVQKIIFGLYLRIPEEEPLPKLDYLNISSKLSADQSSSSSSNLQPPKNKLLLAIFVDEKTINITKNYILDFAKFRFVLKKEDKKMAINAFGGMENILKVFPFFNKVTPIDEETRESRISTSYNNAVIMYPGLFKRVVFGLAAPIAYTLKNRRGNKKADPQTQDPEPQTQDPEPQPEPQEQEPEPQEPEERDSVSSNASTVIMGK